MKKKHPLHPRTAIINKTQKAQSKKIRNQALEWLAKKFPEAFDNNQRIRPLKTGIMNDILEFNSEACTQGISRSKLREAVVVFTRRLDYLTCLKAQEMRIDLNGNAVSSVSQEEAEKAANQIKRHIEKKSRNARVETIAQKRPNPWFSTNATHTNSYGSSDSTAPINQAHDDQPENAVAYTNLSLKNTTARSETLIKHKITRTYDPNAVARLKEKLGLAQRKPEHKES